MRYAIVALDTHLDGRPALAGLHGPYETREAAEADVPQYEENGAVLSVVPYDGEPMDLLGY